ncbi:MAG TPA: LEPR-XLL domain-containing protein, partial [Burkholderiales bacterium]|nr:LEPR-XLL domain-containing protein [Burkholderiales bacterium]
MRTAFAGLRRRAPSALRRRAVFESLEPRILLSVDPLTFAPTVTWSSNASGFWDVASNWSTGVVPGINDNVLIDKPGNLTITVRSGTQSVNSLLITEGLVVSGGTLAVAAESEAKGTFVLSGGVLGGAGVFNLSGSSTWSDGTMGPGGQTLVTAGATLNITTGSTHDLNARTLVNQGTVGWLGGHMRGGNGAVILNEGLWLSDSPNPYSMHSFGGTAPTFDNRGTFRNIVASNETTTVSNWAFVNRGTV